MDIYTYIYIYIFMCVYVFIYAYIHTYIYTYVAAILWPCLGSAFSCRSPPLVLWCGWSWKLERNDRCMQQISFRSL